MKRIGKIAVCLAVGMALNASLSAAEAMSPNNPYAPIVARNVFGLNPPKPADTTLNDTEPPPKITPNGIMTIFGNRQVLFKVSIPARRGIPAKENDYILSEGQRQDDIEVTSIDEKSGVVTFNNHGVVQEIPLTVATAISTPVADNQIPPPPLPNYNNGFRRFGGSGRFGHSSGVATGGNNFNGANNNGVNIGSGLQSAQQQPVQQIDPDVQTVMIEANRELHKNDPNYAPLPITELTPADATGPSGAPLRDPSSPP
jgi:hypothetical protein